MIRNPGALKNHRRCCKVQRSPLPASSSGSPASLAPLGPSNNLGLGSPAVDLADSEDEMTTTQLREFRRLTPAKFGKVEGQKRQALLKILRLKTPSASRQTPETRRLVQAVRKLRASGAILAFQCDCGKVLQNQQALSSHRLLVC